jgi:hypothetical protein
VNVRFSYNAALIVVINEMSGLKPNLQEMIHSKLDEVR